jgi:hypothetical protein
MGMENICTLKACDTPEMCNAFSVDLVRSVSQPRVERRGCAALLTLGYDVTLQTIL